VTGTFGHQWKDFDAWEAKYGKGDLADAAVNLSPSSGAEPMASGFTSRG